MKVFFLPQKTLSLFIPNKQKPISRLMSQHWCKKFILANLSLRRTPRVLIFGAVLLVTAPSYLNAVVPFAFWTGAGTPSKLAFSQQPSSTALVDTNLTTQPKVAVTDSSGRLLSGQTNAITLAAYSDNTCTTSAGGTLGATTNPLNAAGGIATFAGVQYSAAGTIYLKASAAGLTSACSSAIIVSASGGGAPPTAPIPQRLSVTSPTLGISPVEGMTNTCIPLKIAVEDFWGTRAAATSNVTINLTGNGSGTYYSNSGCTSSIVTAQVLQSQSEVTVYFKNTVMETDVLFFEDQTGILGGTFYSISFEGTRLVLSGPQSMLIGAACAAYTLQHLNADGTTASGTLTITFDGYQAGSGGGASSIHTASSCSGGNKITAPVSVTGSYTFYFKPPGVAASLIFTATPATTPPKAASLVVAVNSAAATKLIVSGHTTPTKNRCSTAYTVTSQTATSINAGLNANTTVNLSQTANAQFYSDNMCTTPVSSIVIAAGTAQATFYIKDGSLESTTLTAASAGLTSGNLAVTFGNGNPMNVSAGDSHTCVVLSDQSIKCWGKNDYGQLGNGTTTNSSIPITIGEITTATSIAAGQRHTCTLLGDQTIKCWGLNYNGTLGNGTTTDSLTPVSVSGISTAIAISSGSDFACALLSDQSVKCWGRNDLGQLGNGDINLNDSSTPVTVSGITTATAISAGSFHACALLSDQSMRCWGSNSNGKLGNNSLTNSSTPVVVSDMTTAIAIAAGSSHTCAILSDQSMKCWGGNGSGQLGDGTTTLSKIPIAVNGITLVTTIATGTSHTCALLSDQTIKCWGDNTYGQLGGGNTYSSPPVAVSGITTASSVAAGGKHSCTRLSDQSVKCWGDNNRGQLGTGNYANSPSPTAASGITTATAAATGRAHSCTLLSDQSIKCWGEGGSGQRGNGSTSTSASPVAVSSISTATAIAAAGGDHTCALLSDQSLRCWGANVSGQLGNGSGIASFSTPQTVSGITTATVIAAGRAHSCAVLGDQSAKCWGINIYGQLGNNSTTNSNIPVVVSGITTATAIATGGNHSCALLSDQSIKCWGSNTSGQLGNGTTTDSLIPVAVSGITTATAVAAGGSHTCALLNDQSIKCWGSNSSLQLGNGTLNSSYPLSVIGITNTNSIATGVDHTCARFSDQSIKCWGNTYGQPGSPLSKVPIYVQYIP